MCFVESSFSEDCQKVVNAIAGLCIAVNEMDTIKSPTSRLPTPNPCGGIFAHEAVPIQFQMFQDGWRGCAGWGLFFLLNRFSPIPMKSTEPRKHTDPLCVEIGIILQEERAARGMSLDEFSALIGVSRQEVRFLEFATHSVRLDTLGLIANGLGMTRSRLLARAEARMDARLKPRWREPLAA